MGPLAFACMEFVAHAMFAGVSWIYWTASQRTGHGNADFVFELFAMTVALGAYIISNYLFLYLICFLSCNASDWKLAHGKELWGIGKLVSATICMVVLTAVCGYGLFHGHRSLELMIITIVALCPTSALAAGLIALKREEWAALKKSSGPTSDGMISSGGETQPLLGDGPSAA